MSRTTGRSGPQGCSCSGGVTRPAPRPAAAVRRVPAGRAGRRSPGRRAGGGADDRLLVDADAQARAVAEDERAVLDVQVDGHARPAAAGPAARWRGGSAPTSRRAAAPTGVLPIGLTGRSWAWARAATRRKWVTPQTAAVWTMSTAPGREQRAVLLEPGEVLAGGDRRADRRGRRRPGPSASQRRTGSSTQVRSRVRSSSPTWRTACLRVQDSLASSIRPGRAPCPASVEHVAHQGQAVPVPLDVEAALELGRPQAALGVGLVDRDEFVVGQADVQAGGVGGDPRGRVRRAAATAVRRRPAP